MRQYAAREGEAPETGRKVMFFATGMSAGGAERVIATLANALAKQRLDLVIVVVKGTGSAYELAPGVRLRSAGLEPGLKNLPRALRFYRRVVAQESPDVVASFSTKSDLIALLARLLFRTRGRLVVSERADPHSRARGMQRACDVLYRWADAIVCQSDVVADYYRRACPGASISVIPNPLDEACIGTPGAASREPTVISVGRLSDQKNHALSIRAFAEVRDALPDLRLRMKVYGQGPREPELRELIRDEGLEGIVELVGIAPNVMRCNERAALFLFTSNYEGFPNVLLEAAATGIPTVTTDFSPGTAREIVDDGVGGYVVPRGDREAVVAAAVRVLSGGLDPEAIAVSARRIRESHRTERILEAWQRVLRVD